VNRTHAYGLGNRCTATILSSLVNYGMRGIYRTTSSPAASSQMKIVEFVSIIFVSVCCLNFDRIESPPYELDTLTWFILSFLTKFMKEKIDDMIRLLPFKTYVYKHHILYFCSIPKIHMDFLYKSMLSEFDMFIIHLIGLTIRFIIRIDIRRSDGSKLSVDISYYC